MYINTFGLIMQIYELSTVNIIECYSTIVFMKEYIIHTLSPQIFFQLQFCLNAVKRFVPCRPV